MPKDGNKTRLKILAETTNLVFENGFSGTTIDHILERTNISKGAFFYHFKNKADLALKLMTYFSENDLRMLQEAKAYAKRASSNPKDQLIAFVQWHIDHFISLTEPYAGCLYASFVYEPEQFEDEIKIMVADSILQWRKEISELIKKAIIQSDTTLEIDVSSLADMFTVIMEGAFITAKALNDPKLTAAQLKHYKNYLELLL